METRTLNFTADEDEDPEKLVARLENLLLWAKYRFESFVVEMSPRLWRRVCDEWPCYYAPHVTGAQPQVQWQFICEIWPCYKVANEMAVIVRDEVIAQLRNDMQAREALPYLAQWHPVRLTQELGYEGKCVP